MYHTVQEIADLLKLSRRSVYRMIDAGRLEAVKVGREWRVPEKSVAALLGGPTRSAESRTVYRVSGATGRHDERSLVFMTTDDFLSLPEGDGLTQLIQGFYIHDPAPTVSHQELVGRLHIILHRAIREEGLGVVYLPPVDVVLDADTVLEPDLVAICSDRRHIVDDRVRGAPDLVIEVASPSTQERDLTAKRMLYARYGVPEYWFVSGYTRKLIQFWQPNGERFDQRVIRKQPEKVESTRFSGLAVDLGKLFEDDQLYSE